MEQNRFKRLWQHWKHPRWRVEKFFPTADLERISREIGFSEQKHAGQIRFVVESRYASSEVLAGLDPHTRALQWFGQLGVWDTEHNSGVLVYVSFADHVVEIIADRGVSRKVPQEKWQEICDLIRTFFREEEYIKGLETGLQAVNDVLAEFYPQELNAIYRDDLDNDVMMV
ncbi:TPM domain-containing protein [Neisseria sp. CCUG12390]|uniref:TPM domain-containing protein n=1 Tax=Neisseria sp. CCUG12390 TaxID=3392035 RepID=UPI003A1019D1